MTEPSRPGPPLRYSTPQLSPSVRAFLFNEAGSGAILLLATVLALVWANLPWWESYFTFWATPISAHFGGFGIEMDLRHLINDGAMALFFLVLGLEISRELTSGELRDRRTVLVPTLGAIGGMLLPIGIYLIFNHGGESTHGWGIVMSTDTAFLLGVLALFGPRCPDRLRLFLLTLAVVDDIGAIIVLAVAYTGSVKLMALLVAAGLVLVLFGLRWNGVWRLTPYVFVAIFLWFAVYASGVHPTLAGVVVGLLIPARPSRPEHVQRVRVYGRALIEKQTAQRYRLAVLAASASVSANERLQRALHPWSAYVVIPVFGLANAGVHLSSEVLRQAVTSRITVGVVVALVIGNMVGIFAAATLALRVGLGVLPGRVRYTHLLGGATLAGMGFTISLFITDLAFASANLRDLAKIGILTGSVVAAGLGSIVLRVVGNRSPLCSPVDETAPAALPPLPWTAAPA
jgi:NhaA family Na+:H+ antiporter